MIQIDENTPLAIITVGQFFKLIEQKNAQKEPEKKEEPKDDRTDIKEVKNITGLSYSQIYKLTAKNEIPHRKFGKRLVFNRTAIKDWMEQQTTGKETRKEKAARRLSNLAEKRGKNQEVSK
jgi:excisionase family DNA binding protein